MSQAARAAVYVTRVYLGCDACGARACVGVADAVSIDNLAGFAAVSTWWLDHYQPLLLRVDTDAGGMRTSWVHRADHW